MQTTHSRKQPRQSFSPIHQSWLNRLIWAYWGVGLALIMLGHTVTSYSAGMAIPDWPSTYGYFPLFFPPDRWFRYWDVFLGHSHRLVATTFLLFSIVVTVIFWTIRQHPHKWLATGAVLLIGTQVILGGARVVFGDTLLASAHACVGPLCFGLVTILLVLGSREYQRLAINRGAKSRRWSPGATVASFLVGLTYAQVVLAAQLRHVFPDQAPIQASLIITAMVVLWGILGSLIVSAMFILRKALYNPVVRLLLWFVVILYPTHVFLGLLSWIVTFNFPPWFLSHVAAVEYTIIQGGRLQGFVLTMFALMGSLVFAATLAMLFWVRAGSLAVVDPGHNRANAA
ncbi:MAG: hypothetical protein ACUVQR_07100 [Thermogutta sp.]